MLTIKSVFINLIIIFIITILKVKCMKIEASIKTTDAHIAILPCNKPYSTVYFNIENQSWNTFKRAKCSNNELDVLQFCRQVYPKLRVVNIQHITAYTQQFTIYDCKTSSSSNLCNNKLETVENAQVYKCLYGKYVQQALSLDTKCESQRIDGKCEKQSNLEKSALNKCETNEQTLGKSMNLLKWCSNVGEFNGIEFSCCDSAVSDEAMAEDEDIDDDSEEESIENDVDNDSSNNIKSFEEDEDVEDDSNEILPKQKVKQEAKLEKLNNLNNLNKENEQDKDLEATEGDLAEQERYNKERTSIVESYKQKSSSLVNELKSKKISFKDTDLNFKLSELEKLKASDLLQNELQHNDNIQALINEKKLNSLNKLNEALNTDTMNTENLLNKLNQFIIEQERDRLHQITFYKNLKAYYPAEAAKRLETIAKHLLNIDSMIDTYLNKIKNKNLEKKIQMLTTSVFDHYQDVRKDSNDVIKEYNDMTASQQLLTTKTIEIYEDSFEDDDIESSEEKVDVKTTATTTRSSTTSTTTLSTSQNVDSDENDYDSDEDDDVVQTTTSTHNSIEVGNKSGDDDEGDDEDFDSDEDIDDEENNNSYSDESSSEIINPYDELQPNLGQHDKLTQNDNQHFASDSINVKRMNNKTFSPVLFVAMGACLAVLVIMLIIGLLIKKRRTYDRLIQKTDFQQLDTCSPEERHVNAMQVNGYENPAYRFFETQQNV